MKTQNRFVVFLTALVSILAWVLATQGATVPIPDDQEEPAVVATGDGYFVVWADKRNYNSTEYDIYGARISSAGEVLDPAGIPICTDPGRQTSPRAAFDGERYLVVWEDDRESTPDYGIYQIYGARVTTAGQVLDSNGFKITTGRVARTGPAVASNGKGFFVAWVDWLRTQDSIADIYGSAVSSDGRVANPDGFPLAQGPLWQTDPRIASANGEYLLTFFDSAAGGNNIRGLRLSNDGVAQPPSFSVSNSGEAEDRYGLASNGRDFFVVWGDDRGSPSGFGYPKVLGTLVRGNGVVASPNGIPIATNALYQSRPKVASDGNDFLVVWQESNDAHAEFTDLYGAKLNGDGLVGARARIAVNRAPGVQFNPDVAFTRANYLVAWQDGRSSPNNTYPLGAFDIYGTLVTGTDDVSPTNGFLISGWQSNAPPTVSIVDPTDGAVFTAPATVVLIAHANDPNGYFTIQTVEFFANNVSLGIRTNFATMNPVGPFFLVWTNVPAGEYTLTAKATDDRGVQTTSSPVEIIVRFEQPVVNVEASKADAYEFGDSKSRALVFRVTRTGPIDFDLPVSYRVGGTAQNGVDYEELSGRMIIPIGAREAAIVTYARFDEISEGDETVEVAIERLPCIAIFPPPRECYEVGEHGAARGFIHDVPASLPVVSLELVDPDAMETPAFQNFAKWAEFRVLRTGPATQELEVLLNTRQGTARLGEDYWLDGVNNGSTVRIPAGTSSVNVRLYPIDDDFYEGDETVFFHLIAPPSGTPLPDRYDLDFAHSSVAMVIHDNDPVTTRLDITSPRDGQQFQPGDIIELRAQIVGPGGGELWTVDFFDGDQLLGTTRLGAPIWWGDASGGQHVISARAYNPTGIPGQDLLVARPVTILVGPGAALPVVKIGATSWRTAEPCPTCRIVPGVITIERTAPTNTALTVFLAIDGTATAGDDYQALPTSVEIPAGQRSAQLTLLARDDQLAEGPEIVCVRLLSQPPPLLPPTYFVNVYAKEAFVVIFDDEPEAPQARLDIVAPANGSHLRFPSTVELSAFAVYTQNEVYGPVEFYDGDQLVARSLVTASTQPPIPGLPSVHTAFWTNPPVGQHVLTARTLLSFNQSITSPPVKVTVDSPMLPVVSLETFPLQNASAPESCPPNADCAYPGFVVRRSGPTNADLRIYLSYSGTATAGVDYPALPDSLVIPAGRDTAFLMLVPKDDALVEGSETVIARFTPVPGPGYIQDPDHASATITITDNDQSPPPTVVRIEATGRIAEEDSSPLKRLPLTGDFTISRTGPTNAPLPVFVQYSGTATAGKDYPLLPWLAEIPAGATSTEIRVVPTPDQTAEGIETLVATVSNCPPLPVLPPCFNFEIDPAHASAAVFIRDDGVTEASLTITKPKDGAYFTAGTSILIEAVAIDLDGYISGVEFWDGEQRIGVSEIDFFRAPDPGTPIQHSFEWRGAASGSHLLTARAPRADGTVLKSIPVKIFVEPVLETVVRIDATARIAEESSVPFRRMNLVGEFTLSRTGPTDESLTAFVQYSGIATPGVDYRQLPWIVAIPAGATSTAIRVEAVPDQTTEGIETVFATISNCPPDTDPPLGMPCSGFRVDPAHESATVFIRDDGITEASLAITRPQEGGTFDSGETIFIDAVAIDLNGYISWVEFWDAEEKIGDSIIYFVRAPDPGTPIYHGFAWRDAPPGPHVLSARVRRADGTVLKSVPVQITVGTKAVVSVVARDAFGVEPGSNGELHAATFSIRRFGPTNEQLVVYYSLHGTAQNGIDYETMSGRAIIPAGRRAVVVEARPLPDNLAEGVETVILQLEEPAADDLPGYQLGFRQRAVAVISDNPPPQSPATAACVRLHDGLIYFSLPAGTPQDFRVEASSDLRDWETVFEPHTAEGAVHFVVDDVSNFPRRFYRLAPEAATGSDE